MIAKYPSVPKNKLNLLIANAHTVVLQYMERIPLTGTTSVMNIRIEVKDHNIYRRNDIQLLSY